MKPNQTSGSESMPQPTVVADQNVVLPAKKNKLPKLLAAIVAAIIVVIAAYFVTHAVLDNRSRSQARTAATSYITATHKYLSTKSTELTYFAAPDTANDKANATLAQIKKEQKQQPVLANVRGAGAKLPEYSKAKTYAAKVADFNKGVSALQTANDAYIAAGSTYKSLNEAYSSLIATQKAIYDELGSTNDPIGFFTNKMINPLTDAKAKLAKATIPPAQKDLVTLINKACDQYIDAATALRTSYQNNDVHTQQYGYPDLQPIYLGVKALYDSHHAAIDGLNNQGNALAAQAKQLAAQSS